MTVGRMIMWLQEEARSEGEMAQRRALLLDKQQKRSEELRKRRQWNEQERENRCLSRPRGLTKLECCFLKTHMCVTCWFQTRICRQKLSLRYASSRNDLPFSHASCHTRPEGDLHQGGVRTAAPTQDYGGLGQSTSGEIDQSRTIFRQETPPPSSQHDEGGNTAACEPGQGNSW